MAARIFPVPYSTSPAARPPRGVTVEIGGIPKLLRNILFFAHERALVKRVFESAVEFVARVPAARFTFAPDERAWELVR